MRRKQVLIQCLSLVVMLTICGCGQTAQKPAPDVNPDPGVQQTTDAEKRTMASRFSTLATGIEEVQQATVVVASHPGNTGGSNDPFSDGLPSGTPNNDPNAAPAGQVANPKQQGNLVVMVGITLNEQAMRDSNKVNDIKEQVRSKIKADSDKVGEVLVTTDANLIKRLQDVAAGIIQGQPVESYTQNLNELDRSLRGQ
ncbi:MAG: hypothetical protein GX133_09515 [Syntrophomonadaceae bacterium]|nr:hypothetical protein [Syntrophomonadaceae bacterium]